MDNEYEELWKAFKIRIINAREFSLRNDVTLEQLLQVMQAYENHFIKPKEEAELKEFLEEKGLE